MKKNNLSQNLTVENGVNLLLKSYQSEPYPELSRRLEWIKTLKKLVLDNQNTFAKRISEDFGNRSYNETYLAEVLPVVSAAKHAVKYTKSWMKKKKVKTSPVFWFGKSLVYSQPLGVVAVISPWNYPLQLSLIPTINAFSAGNRVLIKPSEKTPEFSSFLKKCISNHFDPSVLQVVEGDYKIAESISACSKINHLFFTGSTKVGKLIAKSAAENLIPTTLELGGKSPAFISSCANLGNSAKSIIAGKVMNSGQTCIAPDYLIVHENHKNKILEVFMKELKSLYQQSEDRNDFTSVINQVEVKRINELEREAKVKGATVHECNFVYKKTHVSTPIKLLLNCNESMQIMKEEIFGPLLPVMFVKSSDEAIEYVNFQNTPLAIYLFGDNSEEHEMWIKKTKSGGMTINDCLLHVVQDNLPFGGVGTSGHGHYHGAWGFENFSKQKPVFIQSKINATSLFRPPYGEIFKKFAKYLVFWV